MSRDDQTDASRDGSARKQLRDVGAVMDFSASTLDEETMANGWTRAQSPVGGVPGPVGTSGMRGEVGDWDTAGTG